MTVAVDDFSSPDGDVTGCHGARVRAQSRSVATVAVVTGYLNGTSVEDVLGHLCRLTTLDGPLILDVCGVDIGDSIAFGRLLSIFGAECRFRRTDWVLVAGDVADSCWAEPADGQYVVRADSVAEALQQLVRVSHMRRDALLARVNENSQRLRGTWLIRADSC